MREDWMNTLMPHFMEAHADLRNDPTSGERERQERMAENRAKFDTA